MTDGGEKAKNEPIRGVSEWELKHCIDAHTSFVLNKLKSGDPLDESIVSSMVRIRELAECLYELYDGDANDV